jgi:membrane dipeptidase
VPVPFDVTGLPLLTEALMIEGFDEADVGRILGGNAIRVLSRALPAS